MSLVWIAPAAVIVLGAIPVIILALRAAREAQRLGGDLRRWRDLKPVAARIRTDTEQLRFRVTELRRR